MGKRFVANMHASLKSTCRSRFSKIFTRCQNQGGFDHFSTLDLELRNEDFALVYFWEFPAILSALQPFQICIYMRKYNKLTFSNGYWLMGKTLWHMCMHHWTLHAKVEFPRFPQMSEPWGEKSIIFHHVKAKSDLKNFRWHPAQSD